MSYNFSPMSDEDIDQPFPLLKDGVYTFEVLKSTRKVSKSGNDMCEIQIQIWDNETGKTNQIFDYLVFSQVPLNRKKIKHFCQSVGLQESYQKCSLPEDLSHLSGKVEIGLKDEQPKDGGGYWPKKNIVIDYVVTDNKCEIKAPLQSNNKSLDEDIPF